MIIIIITTMSILANVIIVIVNVNLASRNYSAQLSRGLWRLVMEPIYWLWETVFWRAAEWWIM